MKRRASNDDTGWCSKRRLALVAAALSSLVIGACSDGTNASSSASGSPQTAPSITLAADLPAKAAVDGLKRTFAAAGINPDVVPDIKTQLTISHCPLGQPDRLTAVPPASVRGLETKMTTTLQLSRNLIAGVNCTFTNDLPADTANSIPATSTSTFVEYQATYIPGPQLQSFLTTVESAGFEKSPDSLVGGVVYKHCVESPATTTPTPTGAGSYSNCSEIWLNGVIEVGLHVAGPNTASVDLASWLGGMIEPIVNALANTTTAPAGVPTS